MIRRFKPSDKDPVLKIWLEASIQAHDFIKREYWESKLDDMWDIYLPMSETYVYCEEAGNEPQYQSSTSRVEGEDVKGFISLFDDTVAALFVSPASQGKGIGRELLDKAKSVRKNLELHVYKKNRKSFEFYKRCGFKAAGEGVDERTGEEEILMNW